MKEFSRKKRIERFIEEETKKILAENAPSRGIGKLDTNYIAKKLQLTRSNASKELNRLFREKKVLKVSGKPVIYLSAKVFQTVWDDELPEHVVTRDELFHMLRKREPVPQRADIFSSMIGSEGSLRSAVEQLKSAVLYPPNGLHILLSGSTGTGKTTMLQYLYRYAVEEGVLAREDPLVSFNCADYADNPQLLMSLLFGYEKGAFTGAESGKEGLVKKAENGILFLDEVHRLPPQAQEMLFQVMDNHTYRKLGQIEENQLKKILFVMATTEEISSHLLKTFTRRIPVTVLLPDLAHRYPSERLEYIFLFFYEESQRIHLPLLVEKEVIEALLVYKVSGNLGQLKVDIKLTCAKAFMKKGKSRMQPLTLAVNDLPESVIQCFFEENKKQSRLIQDLMHQLEKIIEIDFRKRKKAPLWEMEIFSPAKHVLSSFCQPTADHYEQAARFCGYTEEIDPLDATDSLSKIIAPAVYFSVKTILAEFQLNLEQSTVTGLMLHVNTLRETVFSDGFPRYAKGKKVAQQYEKEYQTASQIRKRLNQLLDFYVPEGELTFLTILLHLSKKKQSSKVGIVALSHGKTIAKSMCELVNTLLNTNHAVGLDLPLEESVDKLLDEAVEVVGKADEGRGVLILSDMGSLALFADLIRDRTQVCVKNISPISTPLLLEATSKAINSDIDVENLYRSVEGFVAYKKDEVDRVTTTDYRLLEYVQQFLLFLDPKKTVQVLDVIFNEILIEIHALGDNGLWIKFIFHCSSMIERIILGDFLPYNEVAQFEKKHAALFAIVRSKFTAVEANFFITVPDTELAYVVEIFDTHIG